MRRFDLRHLHGDFLDRMGEILDREVLSGEVAIFLFEVKDFLNVQKSADFIAQRGDTLLNSLRFNEVDWTLVVRKKVVSTLDSESGVSLEILEAFRRADTISFDGFVGHNEAFLFRILKEARGYRLHNPEVRRFVSFYQILAANASQEADLLDTQGLIASSHLVMTLGIWPRNLPADVRLQIEGAQKSGAALYLFHPLEDSFLQPSRAFRYEVGSEEGVVALFVMMLLGDAPLEDQIRGFFDSLDLGYLASESSLSEEELSPIIKKIQEAESSQVLLIIGSDLYAHPRAENIAKLLGILQKHSLIKILLIPPTTNALGIAKLCDLDAEKGAYTLGYNAPGDYTLSSLEGSDLLEVCKALGVDCDIGRMDDFLRDSLSHYPSLGSTPLEMIAEIGEYNGTVVYLVPHLQKEDSTRFLIGSKQFSIAARIESGDRVTVAFDGLTCEREFLEDSSLKGVIALITLSQEERGCYESAYPYWRANIEKS